MRKLPFLLLGISIAACHSKKNIVEQPITLNHIVKIDSSSTMNTMDDLQTLLVDAPQTFIVPAKTIKKIEAKKGLRITVDPDALETMDGQAVTGDVAVTIKEMTRVADMIANNCPTVSDGKMLISDGSYYVGMESNGKRLQIKNGKSLQMEFPRSGKSEMELFYGVRANDGTMNWLPLNKKLENKDEKQTAATVTDQSPYQYANIDYGSSSWQYADRSPLEFPTADWMSFEDSVMAIRKDSIICHYKSLTDMQRWKIWESPFKISAKDRYKYGMSAWRMIDINDYASLRWWTVNGFGQFLISNNNPDSLIYYRDFSIHFSKENLNKKDSINNYIKKMDSINLARRLKNLPSDDIGMIVNKSSSEETKSTGKKNLSSTTKTAVQYYDPVEISNLGWINCDHFYDAPEGTIPEYTLNIKGNVPATVGVYTIFRDINSMLSQRVYTAGSNKLIINENLPLNAKVEFLVYSKIDNKFVQCKQMVTITKNTELPVTFTTVPDEQVKKLFLN